MEKREESTDRMRLQDYKKYLTCCTFVVIGLSLFHMGFEWVGFGAMVAAWACWITVAALSLKRDALDAKGGDQHAQYRTEAGRRGNPR